MPDSSDARAQGVLEAAERILTESMVNYGRLLAADLARLPVDEGAFDLAVDAFDDEMRRLWDPAYGDESSHCDAQMSALEAFRICYLEEAGR